MDDYIDEIFVEIPDSGGFIDLAVRAPHPVRLPADEWAEILP